MFTIVTRSPTRNTGLLFGALLAATVILMAGAVPAQAATPGRAPKYGTNVIGGSPARAGDWPSRTALLATNVPNGYDAFRCAATLITSHWLVTAAHCVVDEADRVTEPATIEAAIGVLNLADITPPQRKAIDRIVVNPAYTSSKFTNDIALLRLVEDATQTPRPIVAPSDEKFVTKGTAALIAGWGCSLMPTGTPPSCPPGGYPDALNQASILINGDDDCVRAFGNAFDPATALCAGTGSPNSCFGDSGGPLTILGSGGTKVIAGVTSFGDQHCAASGDHGVYTRLYAFRDWVNQVTAVTTPSAPTAVKAVPGPKPGQITITWGPPATDGDSLISSYHLYFGTEDPDHENHESDEGHDEHRNPSDLTHTFTGLDPKVIYRFTIGAENTAGLGPSVTTTPVRPGVNTPAVISKPTAGRLRGAFSKGVRQQVRCSRACTARVSLQVSPDTALRYGLGSNTTVGSVRATLRPGRKATVTAKFTSAARRKLKDARFLALRIASSATSSGYLARERDWALALRR